MYVALFCTMALLCLASVRANEDLMTQLLPLALKLMSSSETHNMEALLNEAQEEPKSRTLLKKTPSLLPEEVILSDDFASQVALIEEAIESAIMIHFKEYIERVEKNTQTCQRLKGPTCQLKGHDRASRPLADTLIAYANQWSLQLQAGSRPHYWDMTSAIILKAIQQLHEAQGLKTSPDIERYIKHKIRLKKLFAL